MYYEKVGDTTTYYIDNADVFPVSIVFTEQPDFVNMIVSEKLKLTQVIPANAAKIPLINFVILDKRKSSGIRKMPGYRSFMGNITINKYDADFVYDLPFKKGATFNVYQGNNGNFSHQNEFAIDFTMPIGTEILAAREGMVIDVKEDSNSGCPAQKCANQGNVISIMHSDGTIGRYYHLQFQGSKVNVGDQVIKGQTIGLSGNTGWSSGPHLHFETYLPTDKGPKFMRTIKTIFRIGDGTKSEFLKEKQNYTRNY